jgi:hypothetical protein
MSDNSFQPPKNDTINYGPLTVHQNGKPVKYLAATPTPVVAKSSHIAHSLENVRLSLHIERFEAQERLSSELTCVMRFPEYSYELKHTAPYEMRAGQTHGAAVVQATCICLDFEDAHGTPMELEYFSGEVSLATMSFPVKFPSDLIDEEAEREARVEMAKSVL